MKRVLLIAATFLMVPIFSLAAPAKKVRLGFVNSITGAEAPIGENLSNGVTLALEDLKKEGIDVDLIKEDDTGKPDKSMAAFETRRSAVPRGAYNVTPVAIARGYEARARTACAESETIRARLSAAGARAVAAASG